MDDFKKYRLLRENGHTPHYAYQIAEADGLNTGKCIRMLREVFQLSLIGAKEITLQASNLGMNMEDYQEKLIPGLENILRSEDENSL